MLEIIITKTNAISQQLYYIYIKRATILSTSFPEKLNIPQERFSKIQNPVYIKICTRNNKWITSTRLSIGEMKNK